jgi:hypothetical protein
MSAAEPQPAELVRARFTQDDFEPPSADGFDRFFALKAYRETAGELDHIAEPPRCHGYANCCHCPACEQRAKSRSARRYAEA